MGQAYLAAIRVYPVKSLDGAAVESSSVVGRGALRWDREWALHDAGGRFINGKREARVHLVRASFDLDGPTVSLSAQGRAGGGVFHLERDARAAEAWLAEFFGRPVELRRDAAGGFPDDREAPGPTVVSTATLEAVRSWFPGMSLEEARRRFRANLEIGGVEAFWEDRLVVEGRAVPFAIGAVRLEGLKACRRCVVPTRGPDTGEPVNAFSKTFMERRRGALPPWAPQALFASNAYRLTVNTRIPEGERGKSLKVGDALACL